ncbi:unnamed protein product [Adineta ricciae]|uniref:Thioredoxin domain-containing protein n=1 Tax=Adineta ricciae TaxID=249248 RepID=A0A814ETT8_ADIRI|nr:unnamed protein product [Adineta ricciae]
MGCCRKDKQKTATTKKNDKTKTIQTTKAEKKKSTTNNKEKTIIDDKNHEIVAKIIEQTKENTIQQKSPSSPSTNDDIFPTDNISPVKTFDELKSSVGRHTKPISILLFHGQYCPFSKRTIPDLRRWARDNKDRIYLYEANVEHATNLIEYYHVRTIPTLLAFEGKNLLVPIWQRTASNVLSTIETAESMEIESEPDQLEEILQRKLNDSNNVPIVLNKKGSKTNPTSNENKQEQYILIVDNDRPNADRSVRNGSDSKRKIDQSYSIKSLASSQHSSYAWNQSVSSVENKSETTELIAEYRGRMVSQTTFSITSSDNLLKKKFRLDEYFNEKKSLDDSTQQIHLSKSNEIFYQKHYNNPDEDHLSSSSSYDRFSTLIHPYMKNAIAHPFNQEEKLCILYFGPNHCRGFEDNLLLNKTSSKLSLLTLKSHVLIED